MPEGYIQLGAGGSSPSICPARATGWVVMIMVVSAVMAKDKDIDNFQAKQKFHNKFKRPTPFF